MRPSPLDARLGSSDTAVDHTTTAAAGSTEPQQNKAQTAAGKFKAVRAGMAGLASRRRATGEEAGEGKAEKKSEPAGGEAAPAPGRFQGLKGGLEGLKAKRRTAESRQSDAAAVKNEKTKPAPEGDGAAAGGRFKSLKEGLGNMKAKKTGTEAPASSNEKAQTYRPGFIERMRWVWIMA